MMRRGAVPGEQVGDGGGPAAASDPGVGDDDYARVAGAGEWSRAPRLQVPGGRPRLGGRPSARVGLPGVGAPGEFDV